MSILDIFKNADFGSALDMITAQAGNAARNIQRQTPGGLGGLLGAGALGTLLGNLMGNNAAKGVALAGMGAVAWNFYKKWAQAQQAGQPQAVPSSTALSAAAPQGAHNTAELVARAMTYAAKSDGNIDPAEQSRIETVLTSLIPGQNMQALLAQIRNEPVDPTRIAAEVISPEQGEDVYRLSCIAIDVDQFMERSYLAGLAQALKITPARKSELEKEAADVKSQLKSALPA